MTCFDMEFDKIDGSIWFNQKNPWFMWRMKGQI